MSADEQEALRRRLYEPGASADDVAAYSALRVGEPPGEAAPASAAPARRRPSGWIVVAAGLVAVLAIAGGLLARPAREAVRPRPTADVAAVAVTTPERIAFIRALVQGGSAGVSSWLDQHARSLPGVLATATRSDTTELQGDGTRRIRLDPPSVGDDGGHVTVLLVSAVDARVTWTLLRDGPDPALGAVAGTSTADQEAGGLSAASVSWSPGGRPRRLLVVAPDGVRWGAAVVFSG